MRLDGLGQLKNPVLLYYICITSAWRVTVLHPRDTSLYCICVTCHCITSAWRVTVLHLHDVPLYYICVTRHCITSAWRVTVLHPRDASLYCICVTCHYYICVTRDCITSAWRVTVLHPHDASLYYIRVTRHCIKYRDELTFTLFDFSMTLTSYQHLLLRLRRYTSTPPYIFIAC
jgi:hypothetical protein